LSEEKQDEGDSEKIKKSLDEVVTKLESGSTSSESWARTMASNPEAWKEIKAKIHDRQKALKTLVRDKKAGSIGSDEFDKRFRELQDELTELEFKVYNLRLGTNIES